MKMELDEALEKLKKAGILVEADEEGYYSDQEVKEILAKLHKTKAVINPIGSKYRIAASDNTGLGVIIKDDPDRWYFKIYDMQVNTTYMQLQQSYGTDAPKGFSDIDEACEIINRYCEAADYLKQEKERIALATRKMLNWEN